MEPVKLLVEESKEVNGVIGDSKILKTSVCNGQFDLEKLPAATSIVYLDECREKRLEAGQFAIPSHTLKMKEIADVKHMERSLLSLLEEFHCGKLKAFGSTCDLDKMKEIQQQQENLAKLHFEMASVKEVTSFNTKSVLICLLQKLGELSFSVETLQSPNII